MIEKIETTPIKDKYGNCYCTDIPSIMDLTRKLNELIDAFNELTKNKITN